MNGNGIIRFYGAMKLITDKIIQFKILESYLDIHYSKMIAKIKNEGVLTSNLEYYVNLDLQDSKTNLKDIPLTDIEKKYMDKSDPKRCFKEILEADQKVIPNQRKCQIKVVHEDEKESFSIIKYEYDMPIYTGFCLTIDYLPTEFFPNFKQFRTLKYNATQFTLLFDFVEKYITQLSNNGIYIAMDEYLTLRPPIEIAYLYQILGEYERKPNEIKKSFGHILSFFRC
jgi:hypothetical protein